ncbi:MAG: hypothetical protein ABMA26_01105 [Limisphaerales bacterium]
MLTKMKVRWWKRIWNRCEACFLEQNSILWPHLSRTINLLVIVNVSLFFLTGAVTRQGYYFPLIALCLLAAANFLILLPLGLQARLPFYSLVMILCLLAAWFLGASILYWLKHGGP